MTFARRESIRIAGSWSLILEAEAAVSRNPVDIATTVLILPPDAKFLPVSELSARLRARIGPVGEGQSVITRPGFRVSTRLVPAPLAALISEFREPTLLTNAVVRFSQSRDQDPSAILELAFDALATLIEARILVPPDSADAHAPVPTLAAGQAFAGFEIEALVRSLEDTELYRARQPNGDSAALKLARGDQQAVASMLANEIQMLERLGGADTPELLDHGVWRGRAFVAMEWCDGVSIAVVAKQARAAQDRHRVHRVVCRMLEAYSRLHANGILHGDIHAGNVLVRDDGRIAILDFGRARLVESEASLADPNRAGIPYFYDPIMADALLAGRVPPAATASSEQFAISVFAYLLLTGLHPIESPALQENLLRNIIDRPPLPFAARGVAAWPSVEAVLQRGMAKKPDDRFPNAEALAQAFASAGLEQDEPPPWSARAERELDAVIARARDLQPSAECPVYRAWFALRAALAMNDTQLLAAADVLVGKAGAGWRAQSVATMIARARSDSQSEQKSVESFLTVAEPLDDGPEAVAAIIAAAEVLDGANPRNGYVKPLVSWASRRLDRLMSAHSPTTSTESLLERMFAFAALSLSKTGAVTFPSRLRTSLETLGKAKGGSVWLFALAHDIFAHEHFKALALAANLPKDAMARGFALLKLHQLTGDMRWVTDARRLVERRAKGNSEVNQIALLMIELKAPERAIFPSFLFLPDIAGFCP